MSERNPDRGISDGELAAVDAASRAALEKIQEQSLAKGHQFRLTASQVGFAARPGGDDE
jgi:hypothetical protein